MHPYTFGQLLGCQLKTAAGGFTTPTKILTSKRVTVPGVASTGPKLPVPPAAPATPAAKVAAASSPCSCGCGDTVSTCQCGPACKCRKPGGSCYKAEKKAATPPAKKKKPAGRPPMSKAELRDTADVFDQMFQRGHSSAFVLDFPPPSAKDRA